MSALVNLTHIRNCTAIGERDLALWRNARENIADFATTRALSINWASASARWRRSRRGLVGSAPRLRRSPPIEHAEYSRGASGISERYGRWFFSNTFAKSTRRSQARSQMQKSQSERGLLTWIQFACIRWSLVSPVPVRSGFILLAAQASNMAQCGRNVRLVFRSPHGSGSVSGHLPFPKEGRRDRAHGSSRIGC